MSTTYLITGANRGIGLELSKNVLSAGDSLIALCRRTEAANALQKLAEESDGRAQIYAADVSDETMLDELAQQIDSTIDVLVCNAGVMSARGSLADPHNTAESVSTVLLTNIAGPFFTARAFLKNLKLSKQPRIAIISSYMGSQQHSGAGAYFYRASKAGVNNIMVTLANELKTQGIAVASYHPGWVQTDMGGSAADITSAVSAKGLIERFGELNLAKTGQFFNYDGSQLPL
jgi:NAD(P)-dependent dehydrogenase (short-subunit alcohol dehydrogenase family)